MWEGEGRRRGEGREEGEEGRGEGGEGRDGGEWSEGQGRRGKERKEGEGQLAQGREPPCAHLLHPAEGPGPRPTSNKASRPSLCSKVEQMEF